MISSNFSAARRHLESAREELSGQDETSQKARAALDLFIEAILTMEFRKPEPQIIPFPRIYRSNDPHHPF